MPVAEKQEKKEKQPRPDKPAKKAPKSDHVVLKTLGIMVAVFAALCVYYFNTKLPVDRYTVSNTKSSQNTAQQAIEDQTTWRIQPNPYESKDPVSNKVVTGTLYAPLDDGAYLCKDEDQLESMYVEKKEENGEWIKLCDTPPAATAIIRCEQYNAASGNPIKASVDPIQCGSSITAGGVYRIHGRVKTECDVDTTTIGKDCQGIIEIFSSEIQINE